MSEKSVIKHSMATIKKRALSFSALACLAVSLFLSPVSSKAQEANNEAGSQEMSQGAENAMGMQFRRVDNVDTNLPVNTDQELNLQTNPALSSGANQGNSEEAMRKQKALQERLRREERDRAVSQTRNQLFPLQPGEIEDMLQLFNMTRETAETAGIVVPRAEVRVENISLDPSARPKVIRTAPGHVTTVTMLDVSGQPWPIQDVSWAGNFEVVPPEEGGHVIRVTPLSAHGIGNISIRMIDLPTPVTFSLQTSPDVSYYRFDARLPDYGPNGMVSLINEGRGLVAGDAVMTALLNGAPPAEAVRLSVEGVDGRTSVWKSSGRIFVRTPYSLLSPGWTASASSGDGMKIYQIGNAPVLLLSDNGSMVRAKIGKEEIVDDGE